MTALRDSSSHFGDGHPDGEGVHSSSGRHTRGLPRLSWWGARGPTEVDVPQRRSVYTSGHIGVATESEVLSADSHSHLPHLLDGSKAKQRLGAAFSRFPVDSRHNPTESSSSHAPARNRSRECSNSDSPEAFMRNEEHDDSFSPDSGDVGDVAIEEGGDLAGLDVSASLRSNKRGGVGRWGVKSKAPVAVDLPRRRSGYSVDTSAHSMENTSVAAGPLQQNVADDSRAEGDDPIGDERGASNGSRIRGSSVFTGLGGLNRGPVKNDIPRRRRSSKMSLPEEGVVLPMEDVSSSGGDGTSGTSADEDKAVYVSHAPASRGLSGRVSARGGWRSGLKRRAPVVVDLLRRSSGYSVDGSGHSVGGLDVAGGQSLRLQRGGKRGRWGY